MEPLVSAGDQVVCITVPKELSGTYNSAMQAASQLEDGAVTVIDAGTASVGHTLQVIAAAEDAARAPDGDVGFGRLRRPNPRGSKLRVRHGGHVGISAEEAAGSVKPRHSWVRCSR